MKLDALDHPKTFDFAARLDVQLPTAIGHLELLWAFTGKQAAQGNIGKWPDGAIARACYWMGDPESFISALVESGFVDADDEHRLVIHDWHEHSPGWVRAKLKKLGIPFISTGEGSSDDPEPTSEASLEGSSDGSSEPSSRAQILPSVVKGSVVSKGQGSSEPSRTRKKPKPATTPIPEDFGLTPERQAYAEKYLPSVDAVALMAVFRSSAKAKGWQYVDWDQHWQTLVRQWAPDSGHWSSGSYPRRQKGRDSQPPKEEFRAPGLPFAN
jgi:hypothetical protein